VILISDCADCEIPFRWEDDREVRPLSVDRPFRDHPDIFKIQLAIDHGLFEKLRFLRVENQMLSRARLVGVFGTGLHGTGAFAPLARILTKSSESVFGLKR
jgi:hypothetical protein